MTTVKSRTPAAVAIGVLALVACCVMLPQDQRARRSQIPAMHRAYVVKHFVDCDSSEVMRQLMSIPNLVLFLDNDLAVQARASRGTMVQLHKSVLQRKDLPSIQFWRVANDLTGSEISDSISGWLEEQEADSTGHWGGNGGVYWVSNGRVLATVPYAYGAGFENLLQTTLRVFSRKGIDEGQTGR